MLIPSATLRGLRGNLLSDGVRTFAYDAANRLTSVTSGTLTTTFEYDGLPALVAQAQVGNRTAQTVDGVTTEYVLDVAGGLPEVIVATRGEASTRYVQVQGQVLAQQDSGAWTHILPDHLGSVRQLVDATGQVSLAQSYDPFGVPFETSGSGESDFGYTGEWWGSYTDLAYHRARYYNPLTGGFLSKDPWPGTATHPETLHGYMYAANNPIMFTDPSGLDYIRQVDRYTCDDPHAYGGYVLHFDKATGLVDWWPCIVDPANVQMNPNPYRDGTEVPIPPNAPGYPVPNPDGPRRSHGWGPINSCSPLAPDDVSWRYRPECWAPLPTVLETWEQVEASYVNTPFSGEDGYAVGGSLTAQGPWSGCVPNAMVRGTEIVYDFFHQQRGSFSYSGRGSRFATSLLAVGVTGYVGYLEGFSRWPNEVGVEAYEGVSLSLAGSYDAFSTTPAGLPEAVSAGLSAGGIFAASYDLPTGRFNPQGIRGIYFGASAGGGVGVPGVYAPVSAETYLTEYELKGDPKVYSGGFGDNKVNRLQGAVKMIVDMRVHGWGNGKADSLALQWAIRGAR
ncbi:MAG: RHS repeat-associated core domain-containing protein [Anaerolineae bacterium]